MHQGSIFHSRLWSAVALFFAFSSLASAQGTSPPRITSAIDEARLTTLQGNTHPLARPEFDRGPAPSNLTMQRMLLVLKRSAAQETALEALLDQQQDKSSPNYHQWLTPDQFGRQFGPADQDILTVTLWLQSHGFEVNRVSPGRTVIEFSGTAGQVQEAFHAAIHRYNVNGEDHWANSSDPQIPAALVPVVAGVDSLNNFPRRPMSHIAGPVSRSKATGQMTPASPMFNLGGTCGVPGIGCHAVGPYDFATIYDVSPLWTATPHIDGTGQAIAIVAVSNINIQDVRDFRNFFGLPAKDPQIILNGTDPGLVSGPETEADLDTEWAGAVALNATIDLIVSESTESTDGTDLSAEYAVENNVASILSVSFGECEAGLGTSGNQFFSQLWQQASAQGITVLVSTGDSGSAGCDIAADGTAPLPAEFGLQVNGLSSTPYNVAVGGTDFNDLTNASTYWNSMNSAPPGNPSALPTLSAKSYIPETTWNDSCTNAVFGTLLGFSTNAETNCNNPQIVNFVVPIGASGGKSSCTSGDGNDVTSCSGGYSKPSWQVGTGVPGDGKRDLPDVSLFSAVGSPSGSFYVVCEADVLFPGASSCDPTNANTNLLGVGGTSASVQVFAGIMALVNQETNSIQGNANYILYKLAAQQPTAFHDVPAGGTIAMPCATGTPNCVTSKSGDAYGVLSGYSTTSGYDLATGLGSVDANIFVAKWSTVTTNLKTSTTTLTLNSGNPVNITHGQSVNVAIGVTGSPGTPTGNVSLIANTGPNGQDGVQDFTLTSGAVSSATTLLPGGTYSVFARYPGDGIFGTSASSPPVAVTIAPEASKTSLSVVTFDQTGHITSGNAASFPYGSPYVLRADVTNNSGSNCFNSSTQNLVYACPTGSVGLKDSGATLGSGTFALNSQGYTEYQAIQLTGGSHTLTGAYGGDGSYSASTGTDAVTVTPAPTITTVFSPISTTPPQTIILGTPFFVNVQAQANSSGAIPGGTFIIFDGTTQLTSTVFTAGFQSASPPQVSLTGSIQTTISGAGGPHTITAHYSGDSNYAPSVSSAVTLNALYPVSITLSATPNPVLYGNSVTVTATLDTGNPASNAALKPTGTLSFFASGGGITGGVNTTVTQDSSGNWVMQATVTTTPPANESIQVTYSGDSNYAGSNQFLIVNVNIPDFNVSGTSTPLVITAGQTGTATITVTPLTSYTSTVTLGCGGSTIPGTTCTFSPSSVALSGGSSATTVLTLATLAPSSVMTAKTAPPRFRGVPLTPSVRDAWWGLSVLAGLASLIVFVLSDRPRFPRAALGLALIGLFSFAIGCGGGSSGSGAVAGTGGGVGGGTGPAATTTTINTTSTKFALGDSATLTATVKSSSPVTGGVTFNDANFPFVIGFVNLANGTGQIQMSATGSIFPGTHPITAQYNGNNLPSQSGALNIVVTGDTTQLVFGQTSTDTHTIQLNVTIQ